jgi:hypothetical protein
MLLSGAGKERKTFELALANSFRTKVSLELLFQAWRVLLDQRRELLSLSL